MSNRPEPSVFAQGSYILAFVSAFILLASFFLGFRIFDSVRFLRQIVWLALITSGIGSFLAYAARSDFKRRGGSDELQRRARIGWRINLATFVLLVILAVIQIVVLAMPGIGA